MPPACLWAWKECQDGGQTAAAWGTQRQRAGAWSGCGGALRMRSSMCNAHSSRQAAKCGEHPNTHPPLSLMACYRSEIAARITRAELRKLDRPCLLLAAADKPAWNSRF